MPDIHRLTDGRFTVRVWLDTTAAGTPRYRIRFWYRGHPASSQTAPDAPRAVAAADAIWTAYARGDLAAPALPPGSIGEAAERWVERSELADATVISYAKVMTLLLRHIGEDRPLTALTGPAIARWLGRVEGETSRNSYLRTVRAWVRWLVSEGHMPEDVTAGLRYAKVRQVLRPWLRHGEWPAFLAACSPMHRIRAEWVLHTGMRATEVAEAQWSWIHGSVGRKAVTIPAHKSARARAVPLDARAVALLDEAAATWGRDEPLLGSHRLTALTNLRRDTVLACERAG